MLNYRHVKNTFLLSTEIQSLGVALEFHLKGQKLRFWGFSEYAGTHDIESKIVLNINQGDMKIIAVD